MPDSRNNSKPIFAPVFGEQWESLAPVFKSHYGHRAFTADKVLVKGVLDIKCRSVLGLLRPFYRLLGNIPVVSESQVPVTVSFESSPDSDALHFNRQFDFQQRRPYEFRSRMICRNGREVIEIMRFGICWRSEFSYIDNKIEMHHRGYALHLFGKFLPLPVTLLFGAGYGEEIVVDDEQFDMRVNISHALFGEVYSYSGRFKVVDAE